MVTNGWIDNLVWRGCARLADGGGVGWIELLIGHLAQVDTVHPFELLLVERCKLHLDVLAANTPYRESLYVPNSTRKIFCADGASLTGLNQLRREVDQLLNEINNDLSRSFRKLAAARIEY